jgi:hypothetical protein
MMEQDTAHKNKDYNPIAEISGAGAAFGVTKVVLDVKAQKTTLDKLQQVGEALGLNIETLDHAGSLFAEAKAQMDLLNKKKQKIIFLSEEDSFFKKRATDIYVGLRDAGIEDPSNGKWNTGLAITAAVFVGIAVIATKHLFFDKETPSNNVATENVIAEKYAGSLSPNVVIRA